MSPDSQPKITFPACTRGEDSLRPGRAWRHSTLLPCLCGSRATACCGSRLTANSRPSLYAGDEAFSDPILRFHSTLPLSVLSA